VRALGLLLLPALVLGGVYVLHILVALREAHGLRRRRAILSAAAASLDVAAADGALAITGLRGGLPTTFTLRGEMAHVEIDIPAVDLLLTVQPRVVPGRGLVEPGVVPTYDPVFDSLLHVEGAPTDVVRALLGRELRARLVACQPLELSVRGEAVVVSGPTACPRDARALIELAAAAAAAVPAALAEADQRLVAVTGAPYRPELDASALRAARTSRAREVTNLIELREERASAARRALVLATVLGALLVISLYASGG
jgi:hypothetical protein